MVPVEIEPDQVMREVAERARALASEPPRLLRKPPGTGSRLPPIRESDALAAVHRDWAEVHATEQGRSVEPGGGVRARVRAKVTTAAAEAALHSQQADRFLIGDLIRGLDAVAMRVDEIGERLQLLEAVVDELVIATGQDLTSIRAALASAGGERSGTRSNVADG